MAKSCRNKTLQTLFCIFAAFAGMLFPDAASAKTPEYAAKALEDEIVKTLGQTIRCKKMEVVVRLSGGKPGEIKMLAVKMEGAVLGKITADYVTVVYEKPVFDLKLLTQSKKFKILSSAKTKVSILISVKAVEDYIAATARQLRIATYRASLRFSPPYAECFFNVSASELSPDLKRLLDKFVKANRVEGYAVVQLKARGNALFAVPAKVIVNHFVIPDPILKEAQNRVNPIERLPVLAPFRYSIENAVVQKNYIYLSN